MNHPAADRLHHLDEGDRDGGGLVWPRIRDLGQALRSVYAAAFHAAYAQAWDLELPDGTRPDPAVMADQAACQALNDALADTITRHLPGVELVDRADTDPTVIASTWHYHTGVEAVSVAIAWDCTHDFGDPNGLTVTATKQPLTRQPAT